MSAVRSTGGRRRPGGGDAGKIANKAIELAIQFVAGLNRERTALETAPEGLGLNRRRFSADSSGVLPESWRGLGAAGNDASGTISSRRL